jgi:hypothetical protein
VNKTLTRKLIYVVAALAMLAMLIPAMAVPVSAAPPSLSMVLVDPITGIAGVTPDSGYNIRGSIVEVTATPGPVTWSLVPTSPVATITANTTTSARVQGWLGNVTIQATNSGNETASIGKKFGLIDHTTITAPGSTYVTWNESAKAWQAGPVTITDTVYGSFAGVANPAVMQGVILNWYLLPGNLIVDMSAEEFLDHPLGAHNGLQYRMQQYLAHSSVNLVTFANGLRTAQTVTGANGQSTIQLLASGEEAVQVVVIPEYPGDPQIPIIPEMTSYNFYTTEAEVVPQVRWAGEKVVLEKYFGTTYNGKDVSFSIQDGSAALEGISANESYGNSAWTTVQNGFASCILVASNPGVVDVVAGLYEANQGASLGNQHFFTVYFLKFESVKIGDVLGKRVGHNTGLWEINAQHATNPWDVSTDSTTQTLNVSQDALVRANVKGWFTSSDPSVRPARTVNPANSTLNNPETATLTLPAGRWILPDDWATLAGPNWTQSRLHWDIMCNPDGGVTNPNWVGSALTGDQLGDYVKYALSVVATNPITHAPLPIVGNDDVIGPFSPGLELMTPAGWEIVNAPTWDALRPIHTVVPDGKLNIWDAPMPPAKVIYQIQDAGAAANPNEAGYFKAADKTDIYYVMVPNPLYQPLQPPSPSNLQYIKVYTNPFYQELIPAHEAIPTFINNGGYDWNSFPVGGSYGPYMFWEFINQNRYLPIVATSDPSGHPTCVEVYSDNHGEAMVWLNGNWNLDLAAEGWNKSSADVPYLAVVGTTTVQATVDYPYARIAGHQAFQSNMDTKTWLWGGLILGPGANHEYGDSATYSVGTATRMVLAAGAYDPASKIGVYPGEQATSRDRVVWLWVSDRDGLYGGVNGAKVEWRLSQNSGSGVYISTRTTNTSGYTTGISQYNEITKNIHLVNGFLSNTNGAVTDDPARQYGTSYLRQPTLAEKALFNKFWGNGYTDPVSHNVTAPTSSINGLNPDDFVVAAIDLWDGTASGTGIVNVTMTIYSTDFNPDFVFQSSFVGQLLYETNVDFSIRDPLDDAIRPGDANCDGVVNMGDVTSVERMILGYNTVTSNAVLNDEGTVDMGTVVKIERTILGLK